MALRHVLSLYPPPPPPHTLNFYCFARPLPRPKSQVTWLYWPDSLKELYTPVIERANERKGYVLNGNYTICCVGPPFGTAIGQLLLGLKPHRRRISDKSQRLVVGCWVDPCSHCPSVATYTASDSDTDTAWLRIEPETAEDKEIFCCLANYIDFIRYIL